MDTSTLQRNIRGRVVNRNDPGFQLILSGLLWNQLQPKRYPDVIVQVNDEQDVVQAVKLHLLTDLRVATRGGGHSWCGLAVRQGGMLIDLQRLDGVTIDPAGRRAIIQPAFRC